MDDARLPAAGGRWARRSRLVEHSIAPRHGHGGKKEIRGHLLNVQAEDGSTKPHRIVVREPRGANGPCRLVIELLQDLHRDGTFGLGQQLECDAAPLGVIRCATGRMQQDVASTKRTAIVELIAREVLGHADPSAPRVEVRGHLGEESPPVLDLAVRATDRVSSPGQTPEIVADEGRDGRVQFCGPDADGSVRLVIDGDSDVPHASPPFARVPQYPC